MVSESMSFLMAICLKAFGKIMLGMDRVYTHIKMVIFTMEIMLMDKERDMEFYITEQVIDLKDNGKMEP